MGTVIQLNSIDNTSTASPTQPEKQLESSTVTPVRVHQKSYCPAGEVYSDIFRERIIDITKISAIFYSNLAKWKDETKYLSSSVEIILHPSYQRIIGLGPNVIPLILRELADNGGHFFWALQSLTGENPVTEEDEGRSGKMAEAWLAWGLEKHLL